MNKTIKVVGFCVMFLVFLIVWFQINFFRNDDATTDNVIKVGMTEGQKDYFERELSSAIRVKDKFLLGAQLREQRRYDDAINVFEEIFREGGEEYKGMAILGIADTYEKEKNYKKALEYIIISRDEYASVKEPIAERAKYLEYASNGNYEMAVQHAQLAVEADAKLPSRPKGGRQIYIDRLNDIKAAKDYIESLK